MPSVDTPLRRCFTMVTRQRDNLGLAMLASLLVTYQFGYNIGIMSPSLVYLERDLDLPISLKSFIVSISLFGALVGSFPFAYLGHRLGRRVALTLLNIVFLVSTVACVTTHEIWMIFLGRFCTGLAMVSISCLYFEFDNRAARLPWCRFTLRKSAQRQSADIMGHLCNCPFLLASFRRTWLDGLCLRARMRPAIRPYGAI
jgi:hypothetical protein